MPWKIPVSDVTGQWVTASMSQQEKARGVREERVGRERRVFAHLDHREKNGYQRHQVSIEFAETSAAVRGVLYVARPDNPAFLGSASLESIVAQIAGAHGPSGSNVDYLRQLAAALRDLDDPDPLCGL